MSVKKALVKKIDFDTAKEIILKYEWLGTMASTSTHYGIFFDGHIAGAVCFGNNVAANAYINKFFGVRKSELYLLARGACVSWAPKNTNSRLIGQSLRLLAEDDECAKIVIAYADPSAGEVGIVYQATNWIYLGKSRSRTCVVAADGKILHSRKFSQIGGVRAMKEYVATNVGSKIWHEKDQPKKGRYAFILRDDDHAVYNKVSKFILPYPKRN